MYRKEVKCITSVFIFSPRTILSVAALEDRYDFFYPTGDTQRTKNSDRLHGKSLSFGSFFFMSAITQKLLKFVKTADGTSNYNDSGSCFPDHVFCDNCLLLRYLCPVFQVQEVAPGTDRVCFCLSTGPKQSQHLPTAPLTR